MVYYFEAVYKGIIKAPSIKKLKQVTITTVPRILSDGCAPYIEILSNIDDDLFYSNRTQPVLKFYSSDYDREIKLEFPTAIKPVVLFGSLQFKLWNRGILSDTMICRAVFNTAFIANNKLLFTKHTLSPDHIKKDGRISEHMQIALEFSDYCNACKDSSFHSLA